MADGKLPGQGDNISKRLPDDNSKPWEPGVAPWKQDQGAAEALRKLQGNIPTQGFQGQRQQGGEEEDRKYIPSPDIIQPERTTPDRVSTRLKQSEIYPGIGEPIRVAQTSGQILGSQPVFASTGGYLPIGAIEAQRAAADEAAAQRQQQLVKEQMEFNLEESAPKVEDKRFQNKLNEKFDETVQKRISQAKQMYGAKWASALKNDGTEIGRRFQQDMRNLDAVASNFDQLTKKLGKIEKDITSGADRVYSDETRKLVEEWRKKMGKFEEGELVDLAGLQNKIDRKMSIDNFIKDEGIVGNIGQDVSKTISRDDYESKEAFKSAYLKKSKERAEKISKEITSEGGRLHGIADKEEVMNHLEGYLDRTYKEGVERQWSAEYNEGIDHANPDQVTTQNKDYKFFGETVTFDGSTSVGMHERELSGPEIEYISGEKNSPEWKRLGLKEGTKAFRMKEFTTDGAKTYMVGKMPVPRGEKKPEAWDKAMNVMKRMSALREDISMASGEEKKQLQDEMEMLRERRDKLMEENNIEEKDVLVSMDGQYQDLMKPDQGAPNTLMGHMKNVYGDKTFERNGIQKGFNEVIMGLAGVDSWDAMSEGDKRQAYADFGELIEEGDIKLASR